MKDWRKEYEQEITQMLKRINLKKFNTSELMYFYRIVKCKLKEVEQ